MLALCFFCAFIKFSGKILIILWISLIICFAPFLKETVDQSRRLELKYFSCVVLCSSWRGLFQFYNFSDFLLVTIHLCSLHSKTSIPNSLLHLPVLWGYQFSILSGHTIQFIFLYVEIKCQLDATEVFIADLIACSTCFGHHYAHHQELKSIIQ